jgi:hypothetical protein
MRHSRTAFVPTAAAAISSSSSSSWKADDEMPNCCARLVEERYDVFVPMMTQGARYSRRRCRSAPAPGLSHRLLSSRRTEQVNGRRPRHGSLAATPSPSPSETEDWIWNLFSHRTGLRRSKKSLLSCTLLVFISISDNSNDNGPGSIATVSKTRRKKNSTRSHPWTKSNRAR